MSLAPEDLDQIVGAVVAALQEAQTQANKGGTPVPRGNPGTVTTGAEPGGTLYVAPDPSPLALTPPEPIPAKNTYGAPLNVNDRVIYQIADDKRASVSEIMGGDAGSVPSVGTVRFSFNTAEPGHLLLGNGASYPKASYQRLWAYIQGAPAAVKALFVDVNSSTFQMANLGGRTFVIAGSGAGLTVRGLGSLGGAETHLLTEAELPYDFNNGATPGAGGFGYFTRFFGSGAAFNIMDPFVAVNAWIKT